MKRSNQNGFEVVLVVVVVGVVLAIGLAGFMILRNRSGSQVNNQSTSATNNPQTEVSLQSQAATQASEVPSTTTNNQPTPTSIKQNESTPQPVQTPQKRTINFTKGGGSQNGDVVSVSANLSENQTGICTYTFSLNGTERVKQTNSITNSKTCAKDVPLASFPKSAIYSFTLNFLSSDGLVSASQGAYDIEVH